MGQTAGRWVGNLVALSVATLLGAVALELAFRYYLFGPEGFLRKKPESLIDIGVSGLIRKSEHPGVLYELRPNLDTFYYLADLETSASGLRDEEHEIPKPPGTVRVAVLGDSYTMPLGVEIESAYHSVLEKRLGAENPDVRYEFINFGVPGYSVRQSVNVLEHKALAYEPDVVLLGFCHLNDYHVPPEDKATEPFSMRPPESRIFRSFAYEQAKLLASRYYQKLGSLLASSPPSGDGSGEGIGSCSAEDVAYMSSVFSELRNLTAPRDVPVLVAGLELLDPQGPCVDVIERLAVAEGLHYVEASGITTFEDSLEYRIYPLDGHPNAAANAEFADRILRYAHAHGLFEPNGHPPPRAGF